MRNLGSSRRLPTRSITRGRRSVVLATVAAVVAAATFASTRPVIAAPAEQPAIVDPDTDAKFLARGLSISLPEARKRLAAQDEVGRVSEVRGARVRIDHKNPKGLTVEVFKPQARIAARLLERWRPSRESLRFPSAMSRSVKPGWARVLLPARSGRSESQWRPSTFAVMS